MSDPENRKRSMPHVPEESRPEEDVLGQVVRESRTDLRPAESAVDWARVEKALLARVATERGQEASLARFRGSWRWGAMAGLSAAAAVAAMFLGHGAGHGTPAVDRSSSSSGYAGEPQASKEEVTSTLAGRQGEGEVLMGTASSVAPGARGCPPMRPASGHSRVGTGTVVETHKARALWEASGRATWLLEEDSRVAVKASAPLVLGLERGAVEAQVVAVPNGEAFAVDVGEERVAVHGTHLRVAREGDDVTVDLSEGVISIGRPPRTGSTYGTLVVAPAHVHFELADVTGSMRVTHDADAVRAPASFASLTESVASRTVHAAPQTSVVPTTPGGSHSVGVSAGGGNGSGLHPSGGRAGGGADVVAVDPHAEVTIAVAVRGCAADVPHSTDVTATVSSSLELTIGDDGFVRAARFSPPLAPEIQKCASAAIYKTRFADAGVRKIDIVLQR